MAAVPLSLAIALFVLCGIAGDVEAKSLRIVTMEVVGFRPQLTTEIARPTDHNTCVRFESRPRKTNATPGQCSAQIVAVICSIHGGNRHQIKQRAVLGAEELMKRWLLWPARSVVPGRT